MADKDEDKWKASDFGRRAYYLEDENNFKDSKIEVTVKVDGKQIAQFQAREPGVI